MELLQRIFMVEVMVEHCKEAQRLSLKVVKLAGFMVAVRMTQSMELQE